MRITINNLYGYSVLSTKRGAEAILSISTSVYCTLQYANFIAFNVKFITRYCFSILSVLICSMSVTLGRLTKVV